MTKGHGPALEVGIISQWFSPEPVSIPESICRFLTTRGHSVRVLTGFPNYPSGRLYAGYENDSPSTESLAGAHVRRLPSFLSHDLSAARRIRSFLSFSWQTLRHRAFLRSTDVNYVYATPMTSAAVALGNRYLFKTPYVLHIQDLWPESVIDSGMVSAGWKGKALHALIGFGLRPIYRGAKHIIVISSGMKDALIERGVDASKISVVLNWDGNENPDPAGISTSSIIERTAESAIAGIHCIYAGNIGQMQDVETIVRAASLVENEFPIRISIYGSGVAESAISSLIKDLGLKSVQLMGRVSQDKMAEIYDQADFLFVTLKDRPVFRMTIPSKFQASMANGVPVITTVQGDLAEICIDSGVGFVANAEDPRSLADVLRKANALDSEARARMSLRAEQYYRDEMSAELALGRVACVLESASKR